VRLAPFFLVVVDGLTIFRIRFELPSVIVSAVPALALWSAADNLLWAINGNQEQRFAVEATERSCARPTPF
jgi:hypothetical protein